MITLLDIITLKSKLNIKCNFEFSNVFMFTPSTCTVNVGHVTESIVKEITPLLEKNGIKATECSLEMFSLLHEIGHYVHLVEMNCCARQFMKLSSDTKDVATYRKNILEKFADEYAIKHMKECGY